MWHLLVNITKITTMTWRSCKWVENWWVIGLMWFQAGIRWRINSAKLDGKMNNRGNPHAWDHPFWVYGQQRKIDDEILANGICYCDSPQAILFRLSTVKIKQASKTYLADMSGRGLEFDSSKCQEWNAHSASVHQTVAKKINIWQMHEKRNKYDFCVHSAICIMMV